MSLIPTRLAYKVDVRIEPGDVVDWGHAGSCRCITKIVMSMDEVADTIHFTDGTTYNHENHPDVEITLHDRSRPKVLRPWLPLFSNLR